MCRFAALVADTEQAAEPLSALLYDAPHGLERQSYAPASMLRGHVNVDGTGIAWWEGAAAEPLRYVTEATPWGDPNLPGLAPRLRGHTQIAAVRSATPGIPLGATFVAPFVHGGLAGVHNGMLAGYATNFARALTERLPDDVFAAYGGASDSLAVFLTVAARVAAGDDLPTAVDGAIGDVVAVARRRDAVAGLNLAVASAGRVVAARAAHGEPSNTLHLLDHGRRWPAAVVVASEPLDDDPAWTEVAPGCLVHVEPARIAVTPLRGLE